MVVEFLCPLLDHEARDGSAVDLGARHSFSAWPPSPIAPGEQSSRTVSPGLSITAEVRYGSSLTWTA
jgi:hypothetical protein